MLCCPFLFEGLIDHASGAFSCLTFCSEVISRFGNLATMPSSWVRLLERGAC